MEFFKKVDFWLFLYAVKNLQNMVKYSKGDYFRVKKYQSIKYLKNIFLRFLTGEILSTRQKSQFSILKFM